MLLASNKDIFCVYIYITTVLIFIIFQYYAFTLISQYKYVKTLNQFIIGIADRLARKTDGRQKDKLTGRHTGRLTLNGRIENNA